MNRKLRNAVLALAMLLPLTMNGQNNNDGHQLPQRKSVTFPASDIQYWVGTGSNSAVVIIGWDDNPSGNNFALAWGVHWNGSATAANMLDTIATYDSRTSYPGISSGWMNGFYYDDGTLVSGSSASYWCYTINGGYAGAYGSQAMADGDVMEISSSCMFTLTTATAATNPNSDPGTTPADTVDATIAFGDILYWVGSGTDSAAFIVNYAQPDTAFAWGYLFNGSTTAEAMVNAIAAADPRFEVVGSPSMGGDLLFVTDEGDTLGLSPADPAVGYNFWWTNLNGVSADAGASSTLHNGDVFKYGDLNSAHGWDFQSGYYMQEAWPTTPTPVPVPQVTPAPEDATIAAADILYWVGEGQNEVVFAVNWADTALAWGYRFQSDSMLVGNIVDAIATADPRLSYVGSPAYISDFLYADSLITDTLRLTPHDPYDYSIYFSMSVNHVASMLGAGQHKVVNGDFVKFADTYAAVKVDSTWIADYSYWDYTYVWPMAIHAVSVPDTTGSTPEPPTPPQPGAFCGAVGTEGCNAIKADSSAFVAWATGVSVTRGPRNIANPSLGLASTGSESNAIGPATPNNVYSVVSLGDGGSALATFARPIRNGEGPDFAVFENGFSDNSLELAFVEVSTDGQRFVRFPATCLTQNTTQLGNAGQTDPTNLNNLAGKFRIGYGTPFDLEELRDSTGIDIDSIVYVRIVDVVGCIDPAYATRDQYGNIINDPWPTPFESSGFDLTGVGVIHELTPSVGIADAAAVVENIYPNPTTGRITVSTRRSAEATLFDISGRSVAVYSLNAGTNVLDLTAIQNGVYMLRVDGAVSKIVKK